MFRAKHLLTAVLGSSFFFTGLAADEGLAAYAKPASPPCHKQNGRKVCDKPKVDTYAILEFVIGTGGDDLRGDSTAWAVVKRPNGKSKTCNLKVTGQDSWGNGSTHTVTCELSPPMILVNLRKTRITIAYNGQPSSPPFETQDNWNLNSVTINAYNQDHKPICIFSANGNPLHRFQDVHDVLFKANDSIIVTDLPSRCR